MTFPSCCQLSRLYLLYISPSKRCLNLKQSEEEVSVNPEQIRASDTRTAASTTAWPACPVNGSVRNVHCAERVVAAVVCLAYLKSQRVRLEPTSCAGRDTHTWLTCLQGLQSATSCLSALPPLSWEISHSTARTPSETYVTPVFRVIAQKFYLKYYSLSALACTDTEVFRLRGPLSQRAVCCCCWPGLPAHRQPSQWWTHTGELGGDCECESPINTASSASSGYLCPALSPSVSD